MNMKARVVKNDGKTLILYADGTYCVASGSILSQFLMDFENAASSTGDGGKWTSTALDMGEFPGVTMAFVADNGQLVVKDPGLFKVAFRVVPEYLTMVEYGQKHNRSKSVIKAFIQDGRIPGVIRIGNQYGIPADAPYPVDVRSRKPTSGPPRKD